MSTALLPMLPCHFSALYELSCNATISHELVRSHSPHTEVFILFLEQTLMREPPLLSRRWPGGTVLTSSGAVVAGCTAVTEKDADRGCCRPFTLTVMVPTDPA